MTVNDLDDDHDEQQEERGPTGPEATRPQRHVAPEDVFVQRPDGTSVLCTAGTTMATADADLPRLKAVRDASGALQPATSKKTTKARR